MSSGSGHDGKRPTDPGAAAPECVSCGSPSARALDTSDGRIVLCQPCAVMHDIGCP